MDNKQIYKATLCFSIRRVLWDLLALLVWAGVMALGFFIDRRRHRPDRAGFLPALAVLQV